MGIGIAFDMVIAAFVRKGIRITPIHVFLHIRVGVLIDCDGGCRVRTEDDHDAILHAAFRQSVLEVDIDVRQRLFAARLDAVCKQILV